MKKTILTIACVLVGTNSFAWTYYNGKTKGGETCTVRMNLDNQNVAFFSQAHDVDFVFILSEEEINTALESGKTITVEGGDGPIDAKLNLTYDSKRNLVSAVYTQTTFIFTKTIKCNNLQIENE